jgi:hypothetical protein
MNSGDHPNAEEPMRSKAWTLLLLAIFLAPAPAQGQGFAIGARAGTAGIGPEAALGLSDALVIRAGLGLVPFEYSSEIEGREYTLSLPSSFATVGVDFYPGGGPVRIMGGLLFRSGNVEVESPVEVGDEVGGFVATSAGTVFGELEQSTVAPFAGIGFGKHTAGGIGIFLDLGVAMAGEGDVVLSASGAYANDPNVNPALAQVSQDIEDEAGDYLKFWPILSVGLKVPLGG